MTRRILVAEDEETLAALMCEVLEDEGFQADAVHDGVSALSAASSGRFDLLVLDLMLPEKDGFEVCLALRKQGRDMPILMLTARDAVEDRVKGLDMGADDYLVKPFAFDELLARLRALLRRVPGDDGDDRRIKAADMVLDKNTHEVWYRGELVELTAKEFELLKLFMENPNQVLTREVITARVWGYGYDPAGNYADTYVYHLRKKLANDGDDFSLIRTIRGVGYKFQEPR